MNYFYSELFRLGQMKSIYVALVSWLSVIALATIGFINAPAAQINQETYYGSMLTVSILASFFLIVFISNLLNSKNLQIIKQSISFGLSRNMIYLIKFMLVTVIFFSILLFSGVIIYVFGQIFFSQMPVSYSLLNIKLVTIIPIYISAIALSQWLNFLKINEIMTVLLIFIMYVMSSGIVVFLDKILFKKEILAYVIPAALLEKGMSVTHFNGNIFLAGLGLTFLFLSMGMIYFKRMDVA